MLNSYSLLLSVNHFTYWTIWLILTDTWGCHKKLFTLPLQTSFVRERRLSRSAERLWGKIDIAKWLTFLELDVMRDLCNKRTEPSTMQTQFEGLEFCWFERKYMSKFAVKLAVTNYLLCKLERIDFPNMLASVFKAIYLDSTPFTDLNSFMFDFNTLIVLEIEFKLSKPL